MSSNSDDRSTSGPSASDRETRRAEWVSPVIKRMQAGDAEAGGNPLKPEGAFGFGS